jgi:hypothetical protein
MLDRKIFWICKVLNMEEFLNFLHTFCSQHDLFIFFIDK